MGTIFKRNDLAGGGGTVDLTDVPILGFDLTNTSTPTEGQLNWNQDERTVNIGLDGVVLQAGQEILINVRNSLGVTIPNGSAVMANGTLGASGRITVELMDGSVVGNAKYYLGIATEDILAGADGFVTTFGKVRGIDTQAWNEGDVLYIDNSTAGAITNIEPSELILPIAYVISKASNGTLFVRTTNYNEIPINTDIQDALSGKEDAFAKNTAFNKNFGTSAGTVAEGSALNSKADAITKTTQSNLTCDFASTNFIIATVTGNQSFSLSNVPTDKLVTVLIINTGGGDITLPNTADYFSNATFTHTAGGVREYSIYYDGTNRYWQVSEELL